MGGDQEMESGRRKSSLMRRLQPSLRDPHMSSRVSGDPSDTTTRKKVKFAESATVLGTTSNHDCPSFHALKSLSPNFNDPKTFEYKFFREILEKNSCNHKNQLFMEKIDTRPFQQKDVMKEMKSLMTSRHETGSSSLGAGMIIPVANTSSISPVIPVEHEPRTSTKSRSSMNMPSWPTLGDSLAWNPEPENGNGGIFSCKRSRLLQLVGELFSPDEDKSELSRLDLIHVLLQRLGIDKGLYELKFEEFPESVKNFSCGQIQSPSTNTCFFDMENTAIGTELVASDAIEHLYKDRPSHTWSWDYDDELRRLPGDYHTNIQDFPNWPVLENRLLQKNQSSLELVKAKNSELHDYEMSPSVLEWNSSFETHMFIRPDYKDLNKFLHSLPTNESLVPYANPKLLNTFDLSSPGEKITFPLLQWKEEGEEPECSLTPANFVFPQMDSLNVSCASRIPVEMKNRCRKDDIFDSLSSYDHGTMLHDTINSCLDIVPPKLEAAFGPEWKRWPLDFATGYYLSNHTELQLYDTYAEGKPTFVSVGCSFDEIDEEEHSTRRFLV